MEIALLAVALVGHMTLWVTVGNRVHALGIPRWTIALLSILCAAGLLLLPVAVLWLTALRAEVGSLAAPWTRIGSLYEVFCCGVALVAIIERALRGLRHRWTATGRSQLIAAAPDGDRLDRRAIGSRAAGWLARVPGNQVFDLAIHERAIPLDRLDPALDGFSIAHLSDLHMSGRIGKDFFQWVVQQTNALRPDLIAITGDLFDAPACLDWTADTLGKLDARCGVYFVLGNHDLQVDRHAPRRQLAQCGLIDLGGRWQAISVAGRPILLAGNELPWHVPAADMQHAPRRIGGREPLRILLAHAPDQIDWARRFAFDLMLAGHTHGGQIRLPWLGSVVAPSRQGTRYAAGTYRLPPTVMHVSRGISSLTPLRINCPPELSLLRLCRRQAAASDGRLAAEATVAREGRAAPVPEQQAEAAAPAAAAPRKPAD